jgi:hypothetical protein
LGLVVLAAAALAGVTTGCQDQQVRTYIGRQNPDQSYTGLLDWLNKVHKAVCNLEDFTTPPAGARLCKPPAEGGGGIPNPPPPPPWGGG